MSWRVISNSTLIRTNTFNHTDMKRLFSNNNENLPSELSHYLNSLFILLDPTYTGCIGLESLEKFWKSDETGYKLLWLKRKYGIEHTDVLSVLREIAPMSCLITYRKLKHAVEIVMEKTPNSTKPSVLTDKNSNLEMQGDSGFEQRENGRYIKRPPRAYRPPQQELSLKSTDDVTRLAKSYDLNQDVTELRKSCDFDENVDIIKLSETRDMKRNDDVKGLGKQLDTKQTDGSTGRFKPRGLTKQFAKSMKSIELDGIIADVADQIKTIQNCLVASENAGKWCYTRIQNLQKDKMELTRLVYLGKDKKEVKNRIDAMKASWELAPNKDLQNHLKTITTLNNKLKATENIKAKNLDNDKENANCVAKSTRSNTILVLEKKVDDQSRKIKQLEDEKAMLVRDLFHMKGKLDVVSKPVEQLVPF